MKRVAVFAHYDKDACVEQYVEYYLQELNKYCDDIIFVSDCDMKEDEMQKIKHLVTESIVERHGEYDFGSYKRGYLYLQDHRLLSNYDELILCNDSCFGPLISFQMIAQQIDQQLCDFWGITRYEDENTPKHIQSYFLVFKKVVFNSSVFDNFIRDIKKEKSKKDVVNKYEIGLSQTLLSKGFRMQTFLNDTIESVCLTYWLHTGFCPFVKTMAVKVNFQWLSFWIIEKLFHKYSISYPMSLIKNYAYKFSNGNIMRKVKNLKRAFIRPSFRKKQIDIFGKRYRIK